ncbi:MAG: hypothetical protein GKR94_29425 [Gammaproteobacteria bacterium]|nr:hypothetical protein [Gammaproteobacteria bacterium]
MMYWIKDRVETPQQFPLNLLFQLILRCLGVMPLQFAVKRSRGYGIQICEWDDLLDNQDGVLVERGILEKLLEGTEEWFYDLDVEVIANSLIVRFGLHDSTSMYIDAPEDIIDAIIGSFAEVEIAKEQ